jgi:hypothetical protein
MYSCGIKISHDQHVEGKKLEVYILGGTAKFHEILSASSTFLGAEAGACNDQMNRDRQTDRDRQVERQTDIQRQTCARLRGSTYIPEKSVEFTMLRIR